MLRHLELRNRLERYAHADPQERSFKQRMLELCQSARDPMARDHFVPGHFTASAFVLSPDSSALLLIFHGKLHRWLQPGGHIDAADADILCAARREIHEEVGLAALDLAVPDIFDLDIHDIPPLKGDPAHQHFDVRFLFRAPDLHFSAGSDAKAARWVPLHEIDEASSDRSVMRAVEKLQGGG